MSDEPIRGRRGPTLEDVARAASVSRALVSIVMRGAPGASDRTRERVRRIAEELGYRPDVRARLLARGQTRMLGVVFHVPSAYHTELLPSIYAAAERAGYEVVLSGWMDNHPEPRAIDALLAFRCDALLLLGSELLEARVAEIADIVPVVVVGRRLLEPVAEHVRTDDAAGMALAVEHLVSLGHRDIAHVDGGDTVKSDDRVRGYQEAMARRGLAGRVRVIPGGQTVEAGEAAGEMLLSERGPHTAVIAYDDDCAWGLVARLEAEGVLVPEDLSVVGFDGSRPRLPPAFDLTTIRQDAEMMAATAVDLAVSRVEDATRAIRDFVLPPTLIVRGSTAPLLERRRSADTLDGHAAGAVVPNDLRELPSRGVTARRR